jgi:D-sedoheptulose 7-phosphate isomerase
VKQAVLVDEALLSQVAQLADACLPALRSGAKVIFAGNGGSFADPQHLSAESTSRFMFYRAPLASLALGTNNSAISAISNYYGYEQVLARELQGIAHTADVFIPISTSVKSTNILAAVKVAKKWVSKLSLGPGEQVASSRHFAAVSAYRPKKLLASKNVTF